MTANINLAFLIFLAATAALGGLLFGFDIAIITGAGPFLTQHFQLTDLSLGWAFSSLLFGCVIGSAVAGRLTDFYGRRKILLWVAALFAVTSVSTDLASSFTIFIVARFVGGVAVGGATIFWFLHIHINRGGTRLRLSLSGGGGAVSGARRVRVTSLPMEGRRGG